MGGAMSRTLYICATGLLTHIRLLAACLQVAVNAVLIAGEPRPAEGR